jgi:hypothetical protein
VSNLDVADRSRPARSVSAARRNGSPWSRRGSITSQTPSGGKLHVVIVGAGIAALEGALALAELAPDRTDVIVIAPNTEFVDPRITVREPFARGTARRYPVAEIVRAAGADLLRGELAWLDAGHTRSEPGTIAHSTTTRCCSPSAPRSCRATSTRLRSTTVS